ncbi:Unknown protein sequence [Pseudomonas syringae pv. maculicola str. M6]|nr:Unknown protein sequence [Pseudomonas syringae pv. maculicola str. M6]
MLKPAQSAERDDTQPLHALPFFRQGYRFVGYQIAITPSLEF